MEFAGSQPNEVDESKPSLFGMFYYRLHHERIDESN